MSDQRLIAIVGATGAQGGGLARAILQDPKSDFRVRALTRDASSDRAQALAELGAEVVQADLDDAESLKRAFRGAHGAFCVTNFWEHHSPERELQQAENMAEAAQAEDLGNMFQVKRDFNEDFCGARDPAVARQLTPSLRTFDAWLEANKGRLAAPEAA